MWKAVRNRFHQPLLTDDCITIIVVPIVAMIVTVPIITIITTATLIIVIFLLHYITLRGPKVLI